MVKYDDVKDLLLLIFPMATIIYVMGYFSIFNLPRLNNEPIIL
jgi:hypothetical protein